MLTRARRKKLLEEPPPQENPPEPPETYECALCLHHYPSTDIPFFQCGRCNSEKLCQLCVYDWIRGTRLDNEGFHTVRCRCGLEVSMDIVQKVLTREQFEAYDKALTLQAVEKMKDILVCPGIDCTNVFVKAHPRKRCRKAICDACETNLCGLCGELYTKEHARMDCEKYKRWKRTHDEETQLFESYKRESSDVKPCPGCQRPIEKNHGCRSMVCTNCQTKFCWNCSRYPCNCY